VAICLSAAAQDMAGLEQCWIGWWLPYGASVPLSLCLLPLPLPARLFSCPARPGSLVCSSNGCPSDLPAGHGQATSDLFRATLCLQCSSGCGSPLLKHG